MLFVGVFYTNFIPIFKFIEMTTACGINDSNERCMYDVCLKGIQILRIVKETNFQLKRKLKIKIKMKVWIGACKVPSNMMKLNQVHNFFFYNLFHNLLMLQIMTGI